MLLSACAAIQERASGDARVWEPSSGHQAIVVFGMHGVHPEPQSRWQLGRVIEARALELEWTSYDKPTEGLKGGSFRAARKCWNSFDTPEFCQKQMTTHHVVAVAPGSYVLTSLTTHGATRSHMTRFDKKTDWLGLERSVQQRSSPRFEIKAGEVVYIGDYYFDTWNFPGRPLGIRFDDAAARGRLAEYKAAGNPVPGEMVVRRPGLE